MLPRRPSAGTLHRISSMVTGITTQTAGAALTCSTSQAATVRGDRQTPKLSEKTSKFRRQRTPDSRSRQGAARDPREGPRQEASHLTRVHLRLSGPLAQRLHGADAQLLRSEEHTSELQSL